MSSSLDEKQQLVTVVLLLAPVLEILFYGIYLHLYVLAFPRLVRNRVLTAWAGRARLAGNTLIFIFATIHAGVSSSQTLIAFAYADQAESPLETFDNPFRGVLLVGRTVEVALLTTGDVLVVHRCFLLWERRYCPIVIPTLIALISLALHILNLHRGTQSGVVDIGGRNHAAYVAPFALHFVQVISTACMYVLRIWYQLRQVKDDTTMTSFHVPNVASLLRLLIESATIYTIAVGMTVILVTIGHPAQYIAYCCQPPVIGIALVLVPLRTQGVREEAKNAPVTLSILPSWRLEEGGRALDLRGETCKTR